MPTASPLKITAEIATLIERAFDAGNVMLLAVVDEKQRPVLSFRGSTAVFSDTQLSFWVRNTQGGTLAAIRGNSRVAMMYRSSTVPMLQFAGRARIVADSGEQSRAFELAPQKERELDADRKGCAVIVDLDEIKGVLGFDEKGPKFCHFSRDL